jgi:hypothetical protein
MHSSIPPVQLYPDETTSYPLRDFFGVSSGFLCRFFGNPSGAPEGFRGIPEGFPKKTLKRQETGTKKSKMPGRVFLKIYFTEALYTLCNLLSS